MSKCQEIARRKFSIEIVSVRGAFALLAVTFKHRHSAAIEQPAKKAVSATVPVEPCGGEGVIRRSIPGWSDDGASHRMNCDTPPLKGLRLEPFGSIRNHREESMRCALSRFYPEPAALA